MKTRSLINSEDCPSYGPSSYRPSSDVLHAENSVIQEALAILEGRLEKSDVTAYSSPESVKQFCYLTLAAEKSERFGVMFLDNRHRLISYENLFRGTIDGASVHPREVARVALEQNAAAVIFTHNHPSGVAEPSRADTALTKRLIDALQMLDIRVLDHIVVGDTATGCVSFSERGLI